MLTSGELKRTLTKRGAASETRSDGIINLTKMSRRSEEISGGAFQGVRVKRNRRPSFIDVNHKIFRSLISKHLAIDQTRSLIPSIEDLICGLPIVGTPYVDNDYLGLVDRLRADLAELHPQIQIVVQKQSGLPASAVFPFLARKFLELALTGLLARLDPLRVIAARKNQKDVSFEFGRQNSSSVSWTGDILPNKKWPSGTAWCSSNLDKGVERSFLGWHFGEVAIVPGLSWLADADINQSEWLRKLSAQDDPFQWIKAHLTRLYSSLSKGVHAEYLLDDSTAFDQESIQQYMQDCYMLVLLLSTASHISPLFSRSLPAKDALLAFRQLETQIITGKK